MKKFIRAMFTVVIIAVVTIFLTPCLSFEAPSLSLEQGVYAADHEPVTYTQKVLKIGKSSKTVKVITVDPKDPRVNFEVNTPSSLLNVTEEFEKSVRSKKAYAAINANFFMAYSDIKDPMGHVMVNGSLIYGQSGITSLGISRNKDVVFGMPGIFTRLFADGKRKNELRRENDRQYWYYNTWTAYEVNTLSQTESGTILYTPARGKTVGIKVNGWIAVVKKGILDSFRKVKPSEVIPIPQDGYVFFLGDKAAAGCNGDIGLEPGRIMESEYYLHNPNTINPDFKLEEMQWMISGGPDLVVSGKKAPVSIHRAFTGERFTTLSTSRTAVGITSAKKLLLVSVPSATMQEMKEIMLALGARDAVNLDGGGSTGMYYNGKVLAKPGRKLAAVLYIYKK